MYPGVGTFVLIRPTQTFYERINLDADAEALRLFLEAVDVVPLDDAACRVFGDERARLREEGNRIGDMDILIGATAISNNLALLTNSRRHFERMQGLNIDSA